MAKQDTSREEAQVQEELENPQVQTEKKEDKRGGSGIRSLVSRVLWGRWGIYVLAVLVALGLWAIIAAFTSPVLVPGPARVYGAASELMSRGELQGHIGISYFRVLTGWAIGSLIAIPLGLFAGRINIIRTAVEPYVNFFRFIPPIAFISLTLIWLGLGEASKIVLIVYSAFFTVFLNSLAAAQSVEEERIRAASCLGAPRWKILTSVVVPSTIPGVITGLRVGMGYSFMTVIAAEIVAAEQGVGFLIFNARLFARTDQIFVGIIVLGFMGFIADLVFRMIVRRAAYRYDIKL